MQIETELAAVEAECALLGSITIQAACGGNVMPRIKPIISPIYFIGWRKDIKLASRNARFYEAMLECDMPHRINVAQKLDDMNMLETYDCSELVRYESTVPCSLDYLSYAQVVRKYAIKRLLEYYTKTGQLDKARQLLIPDGKLVLKNNYQGIDR